MTTSNQRPIAVDLFAGAGGMTLGLEQAGFDVLAAVEFDPIHASIHEYNFPFWTTLCRDVTRTTGQDIRQQSTIGDRDIDLVVGGPPCQGFSVMGKRDFDDARNSLIFHFLRLVVELQPKFFIMENVKGMTQGNHQNFLQKIIKKFQESQYKIVEDYQILNAVNYGVPQKRQRLFLIGCRQDYQLPNYPQAFTQIEQKTGEKISLTPTVKDALSDLPEASNYPELNNQDWVMVNYGKPSDYAQQLRDLNYSKNNYSYHREYDPHLLTCSRLTKHTARTIARFNATPPGKTEKISRFPKLDLNGWCPTLRAGTARNHGAHTSPRPIHPLTPRCITVREAARLHSFPDWFRFHTTKWHGFRQIGNSVPPLLAKAIASEIIKQLGVQPIKPSQNYTLETYNLLSLNMSQATIHHELEFNPIPQRKRVSIHKP